MEHFDVLIVGAGISGIAAAVHLAQRCPELRVAILEGRAELGGTWDLFRYPGVRSDSDMYTLGFSFRPWSEPGAIAEGGAILKYLKDTACEHGLYQVLRLGHAVQSASWCSSTSRWTVSVWQAANERQAQLSCSFLYMCTGYYDYARGHAPELAGVERFRGRIVHPQLWPPDLDYSGLRIVVIGSGATALSLVPELAKTAAHVTLLQRSPSYVLSLPASDPLQALAARQRGPGLSSAAVRWRSILAQQVIFQLCRRMPRLARKVLIERARQALGDACEVEPHFSPRYAPWQQRLCIAPGGDLFEVIRSGRVSVVTDTIDAFTESGLTLRSGAQLPAELVITATGLELQLLGNIALSIDGAPCDAAAALSYRGIMFSGIPNLISAFGYASASWTLRTELTAVYFCRLLAYMKRRSHRQCWPVPPAQEGPTQPFVDLMSGYVKRGAHRFPQQGRRAPWRVSQSFLLDWLTFRWARLDDGSLKFLPGQAPRAWPQAKREDEPA